MTIILKSDRPVIWKIKSDQVLGNLTIAAGFLFLFLKYLLQNQTILMLKYKIYKSKIRVVAKTQFL